MIALALLLQDPPIDRVDWSWAETPAVVARGREHWVALDGRDTGTGSRDNPFGTIGRALAEAQPGDTVQVRTGVYDAERQKLNFARSGRADAWIVLRSADGPGRAEIDGRGEAEEIVLLLNRSYVVVEGFRVRRSTDNAIHVGAGASFVIVRGCTISGAGGGGDAIKVNGSHHIYVEGNDCTNAGDELVDFCSTGYSVARRNFLHDQPEGKTAMFAKGGSHYILFEGNVVTRIRAAHSIMLGGDMGPGMFHADYPDVEGYRIVARNNMVVDCDDDGFETRGVREGWILHNTIVNCGTSFSVFGVRPGRTNAGGVSVSRDIHILNNLVVNYGDMARCYAVNDGNGEGLETGWNLWSNGDRPLPEGGAIDAAREEGAVVVGDAGLASADRRPVTSWQDAVERFALGPRSPAVNRGRPLPEVLTGRGRRPDIGAIER